MSKHLSKYMHEEHFINLVDYKYCCCRCELLGVIVEVDRIVRPGGRLIVRDDMETISEVESIIRSLHWEVRLSHYQGKEGLLFAQKTMWRPNPSSS
jgi:hypothetical protein